MLGSRTLIVTSLLGVRLIDGSSAASCGDCDEVGRCGGVFGALARPVSVGVAPSLSADMLLYVRSPLSKRGRFLVPEASVSSIGSLAPADFARVGEQAERVKTESMTLCLPMVPGRVLWPRT